MKPTKKKPEKEVVILPEIHSMGHQPTGIGRKLIGVSGFVGSILIIYGVVTQSFPLMFCGTVLLGVSTLAAN